MSIIRTIFSVIGNLLVACAIIWVILRVLKWLFTPLRGRRRLSRHDKAATLYYVWRDRDRGDDADD